MAIFFCLVKQKNLTWAFVKVIIMTDKLDCTFDTVLFFSNLQAKFSGDDRLFFPFVDFYNHMLRLLVNMSWRRKAVKIMTNVGELLLYPSR